MTMRKDYGFDKDTRYPDFLKQISRKRGRIYHYSSRKVKLMKIF
jgi:hypothetical protein